ncbi:hypothetical protein ACSBPQ_10210 [Stenotrophomonas sp. JC08]|uniref:hypothetical protein n=1 Tax=Stenotrophomonas sp. JC08 TaxID=3445779 RepID=UPI003FA2B814
MTSVTDLIDLLVARRQASILHDRRTGMPYSWSHWLRTRVSRAESAFAQLELAEVMAARPRPPHAPAPAPHSFGCTLLLLLWQGGDPPPRDQRLLRGFAALTSAGLHLLFALLLLWVALVRSTAPEASAEEGERVRVEYIGRGTPQEQGGGMPQGQELPAAAQASSPAAASAEAAPARPSATATSEASAAQVAGAEASVMPVDMSRPSVELPAAQPLQVTQVEQPTSDFVLPPPIVRAPSMTVPVVEVPQTQLQVHERTVETVTDRPRVVQGVRPREEVPPQLRVAEVQVRERQIEVAVPQPVAMAQVRATALEVEIAGPEVAVREQPVQVASPQPVVMAQVRTGETGAVQVKAPTVAVRERQLPAVADTPASMEGAGSPASTASTATSTQKEAGKEAASTTAAVPTPGTSPGAGPQPQDRSGGWDAPTRSDDWGAAQRQVAGSAGAGADRGQGLFNADGSVRVGDGNAAQEDRRGAPGGEADSWSRERIAQSGTWLKRPPYDYTPTSFDKYWVPSESLLAEWVRKGIKNIEIPIPGSSSRISCVVSLLQFGGGCGLTDPNMQEQPAEARPPPDIPFKKELQEDNGSR